MKSRTEQPSYGAGMRERLEDMGDHMEAREAVGSGARVITLDKAAEMLCCSYSTVLRLVTDGDLRAFRVRGAWRTSTAACAEFIERGFAKQRKDAK